MKLFRRNFGVHASPLLILNEDMNDDDQDDVDHVEEEPDISQFHA